MAESLLYLICGALLQRRRSRSICRASPARLNRVGFFMGTASKSDKGISRGGRLYAIKHLAKVSAKEGLFNNSSAARHDRRAEQSEHITY
tara:strand:- start:183 stop:452 length:270 start_codon:yes stop_codon:yes gene_type:complete